MIDSKFRNINRLLVLPFKNDEDDPTRNSLDKYYRSTHSSETIFGN